MIYSSKMKNFEINELVNANIMGLTSHTLTATAAYAVTQFKRELRRLMEELQSENQGLVKEVEIEDGQAFDTRHKELTDKTDRTKEEEKELEGMEKKLNRLVELRGVLYNKEVEVKCKPMSFDDWRALKEENKELKIGNYELLEVWELNLEGVMWKAPEE